ncbi:hypothetical protein HNQ34_003346 [Anoxybacillus tepidamans]|uniref:Polymer-forming cytoskeletal protein n=1 Tax=Anoxybacteroides tepidamans TaxID=265948 RepID=A0A7W8IUW9_9BACL|nr:hypothetical protein [Anoxybacillus tepidamans]MBB5326227.1 hypothetical protein [Anoxybacillus tepidamans]
MKQKFVQIVFFLILSVMIVFKSSIVFAAENVFDGQDTVLTETQRVENVVIIGGNATIYGSVRDAVIVLNGDLNIKSSARIKGLVLVIGGKIIQEPGAQLTDNVLNINFNQATANSLFIGGIFVAGVWFFRFILSMMLIILPVVTFLMAKDRLEPFISVARLSLRRAFLIGVVINILFIAICILLSVTIIGLPIAVLLLLFTLFVFLVGFTAVSQIVGEWMPRISDKPRWLKVLGGALLLTAGINFPLIGVIILLSLFWVSLGSVTLLFWGKRKQG